MGTPNIRGVVLGSPWRLYNRILEWGGPGVFTHHPGNDGYVAHLDGVAPVIRSSMLYFDRIDWPSNNVLPQPAVPGSQVLIDAGLLKRSQFLAEVADDDVELNPGLLASYARNGSICTGRIGMAAAQIEAAHQSLLANYEKREPGVWSFAPVGVGMDFADAAAYRGAEIELYNCLPSPAADVPFEEVLEFKRRRNAELLELRSDMDEMYLRIANSEDPTREASIAAKQIDKALADVHRTMHESGFRFACQTMRIDVSRPSLAAALATGMAAAGAAGVTGILTLTSGLLVGATAAAATLAIRAASVQTPIERLGAFKYLFDAAREGIIDSRGLAQAGQR